MNLGIYLKSLVDIEQLKIINKFVEDSVTKNNIYDISIFYDEVAFNPGNTKCGMFNSTDLWSFNGNLIITSLDGLVTSSRVINNINLFYYYGWEQQKNVLGIIEALKNNVKIICRSENDSKEIYRITGKKPLGISENYENIIELLLRCKDEYKSNSNNVYKTA